MTDSDLLGALGGAPAPFTVNGVPLTVRPLTVAGSQELRAIRDKHPDDKAMHVATVIALCVAKADGTPISFDTAKALPLDAANEIAAKVAAVNGWGDEAPNS